MIQLHQKATKLDQIGLKGPKGDPNCPQVFMIDKMRLVKRITSQNRPTMAGNNQLIKKKKKKETQNAAHHIRIN